VISTASKPARRSARFLVVACLVAWLTPAHGQTPRIEKDRRSQKIDFTDAQITEGFFRTAFGTEYHLAGRVDRIRKFDGPVRVYADSRAKPDRRTQLASVVADIGRHVQNLDIAMTDDPTAANVVVTLVRDRNLTRTIAEFYGQDRAKDIHKSLDPQCLSGFSKGENLVILHANAILTVDQGAFTFYDCAYEELLQSLGPINDTDVVPWTMFNDDVSKGYFDIFDQYILNILYDNRIKPGMTIDEVRTLLPAILRDVRALIAANNNLPQ
jgi:hypothetical protein